MNFELCELLGGAEMQTEEDRRTVERLYAEYGAKVLGYIRGKGIAPHDAEDLRGTVFEKILSGLHTYDGTKAAYGTWIYAITRNCVIDYFRRRKGQAVSIEDRVIPLRETPETRYLYAEMLTCLARNLDLLSEREKEILVLHFYRGMDMKKVAEKVGLTYANTRMIQSRAIKKLKDLLEKE